MSLEESAQEDILSTKQLICYFQEQRTQKSKSIVEEQITEVNEELTTAGGD